MIYIMVVYGGSVTLYGGGVMIHNGSVRKYIMVVSWCMVVVAVHSWILLERISLLAISTAAICIRRVTEVL